MNKYKKIKLWWFYKTFDPIVFVSLQDFGTSNHAQIETKMSKSNFKCGYFIEFLTPLCLLSTGFWHEQSRADRDKNVEIIWNNINPAMKYNFMKYTLTQIQHLNAPYDTCSVMHYSGTAFSRVNINEGNLVQSKIFCGISS